MLVKERMSKPVIAVGPDLPIMEALNLMRRESIRRAPVLKDGKLIGIVSEKDLLDASPSDATSLSVWEVNFLLAQIKVKDVMTKDVITVTEDTPIEHAARLMADEKIGGIPVVKGKQVVGLITETDLFKLLLELMGGREMGVRVTALVPEQTGQLALITRAIADNGGSFISLGQFSGRSPDEREVTFKVKGLSVEGVVSAIKPLVQELLDVRECC